MPKFFIDLRSGSFVLSDETGFDADDAEGAISCATRLMISGPVFRGRGEWQAEVSKEGDELVATVCKDAAGHITVSKPAE